MREVRVEIGERELLLQATFAASMEIAETISDPLFMMKEIGAESTFAEAGIPYKPNFEFNVKNIPEILYIGQKATEKPMTLKEIQELVFEEGFFEARLAVIIYLTKIVGGGAEVNFEDGGEGSGEGK